MSIASAYIFAIAILCTLSLSCQAQEQLADSTKLNDTYFSQLEAFNGIRSAKIFWTVTDTRGKFSDKLRYYSLDEWRRIEHHRVNADGKSVIKWISVYKDGETRRLNALSASMDVMVGKASFLTWMPPIFADWAIFSPVFTQEHPMVYLDDSFNGGGMSLIRDEAKFLTDITHRIERKFNSAGSHYIATAALDSSTGSVERITLEQFAHKSMVKIQIAELIIEKRKDFSWQNFKLNCPVQIRSKMFNTQELDSQDTGFPDNIIEDTTWSINEFEINPELDVDLFELPFDSAQTIRRHKPSKTNLVKDGSAEKAE